MTLRQLKDRHIKHGDDEADSDEDDKMTLKQLNDRRKKRGEYEVGSDADDKMTLGKLEDRCKSFGCRSTEAFTGYPSICCHEESSYAEVGSNKVSETVESQHDTPMFGEEQQCCVLNSAPMFGEDQQLCVLNEMSYEHLDYFEPETSPKSCGDMHANDPTKSSEKEMDMESHPHGGFLETVSPARDKNLDVHTNQHEFVGQRGCKFGSHVSDTTIANKVDCADLYDSDDICMFEYEADCTNLGPHVSGTVLANKVGCTNQYNGDGIYVPEGEGKEELYSNQQNVSTSKPFKKCIFSGDSHSCSKTGNDLDSIEDRTTYEDQLSFCCLGDKFLMVEKKQPPKSSGMVEEKTSTLRSQPYDDLAGTNSTPELQQLPERVLSKRKVISPSSQEQLCSAMNSADLPNELDDYKCKEKLLFGKCTGSKHPSEHPRISHSSIDEDSKASAQVRQAKVIIGPNEIAKRLKRSRKGYPLNSHLKDRHLSRPLPQLSTGCTSVQHFCASAIAFSERQMRDTESLAVKLMNELKSMKDIVEGKFLLKACNSASLKNEADEVLIAIKNANKVEEKARKRLSSMNKDCTRFCKLMPHELQKISHDGAAPYKDTVHRERKITFADEAAGGMLCHVNYYGNMP